jgi:GNAT superfamily N-acetyltransferase
MRNGRVFDASEVTLEEPEAAQVFDAAEVTLEEPGESPGGLRPAHTEVTLEGPGAGRVFDAAEVTLEGPEAGRVFDAAEVTLEEPGASAAPGTERPWGFQSLEERLETAKGWGAAEPGAARVEPDPMAGGYAALREMSGSARAGSEGNPMTTAMQAAGAEDAARREALQTEYGPMWPARSAMEGVGNLVSEVGWEYGPVYTMIDLAARAMGGLGDRLAWSQNDAVGRLGSVLARGAEKVRSDIATEREERRAGRREANPLLYPGTGSLAEIGEGALPLVSMVAFPQLMPVYMTESAARQFDANVARGMDEDEAAARATLYGLGNFALTRFGVRVTRNEMAGLQRIARGMDPNQAVALGILTSAASGAGTAATRELWSYLTANHVTDMSWEHFQEHTDVWQAAAAGALISGVMSAPYHARLPEQFRQFEQYVRDGYGKWWWLNKDGGAGGAAAKGPQALGAGPVRPGDVQVSRGAMVDLAKAGGWNALGKDFVENGVGVMPQAPAAPAAPARMRPAREASVVNRGEWVAETPKGEATLGGTWRVVDASALVTSDQQGYDQRLQPRNRASVGSAAQVDEIARKLNPDRLLNSATTDDGAPIADARGQVISGNGRVMALRRAYEMGTAQGYREVVEAEAAALGVDTSGMRAPVLVRGLPESQGNLEQIAEWSNRPKILERNSAEVAQADAALLSPALLEALDPEKPLTMTGNADFLNAFVGASRDASLLTSSGKAAPEVVDRARNAFVASLAANHPQAREIITTLTEQGRELGLEKQLDALTRAAPPLIRMGALKPEYDLRENFGGALNELVQFAKANAARKAERQPPMTLGMWTGQTDFLLPRDNVADELLRGLLSLDAGQVATALERYTAMAGKIDTSTGDMFGEAPAKPLELLQRAFAEVEAGVKAAPKAQAPAARREQGAGSRGVAATRSRANVEPGAGSNDLSRWAALTADYAARPGRPLGKSGRVELAFVDADAGNPYDMPRVIARDAAGNVVGELYVDPEAHGPGTFEGAVQVHPHERRQGIATALYDAAERETGLKAVPAAKHTADAEAFWTARRDSFRASETGGDGVPNVGSGALERFRNPTDPAAWREGGLTVADGSATGAGMDRNGAPGSTPPDAQRLGPDQDDDYRMEHRPRDDGPAAHDLLENDVAPRDIYQHPEWYVGDANAPEAKESIRAIRAVRGKPDAMVTIYRAAPAGSAFRAGDWVSLSRTYAKNHGIMDDDPANDLPVQSMKVPAAHVRWAGDDLNEFGYYPAVPSVESSTPDVAGVRETGPAPRGAARASVADVTGPGWPGAEMRNPYKVTLPPAPQEGENTPGELSRWIGRPVQSNLGSLLARMADPSGVFPERFDTAPDVEGVRVDMDPYKLQGTVDQGEGWAEAWAAGRAGFLSELDGKTFLEAVRAVSMPMDRWTELQERLGPLVREWDGHVNEEGVVSWVRPGYQRQMMELPELIAMAQMLGDGKIPKVVSRFRNANWLGVWRSGATPEDARIELRADIFQLITPAEMTRLKAKAEAQALKLQEVEGFDDGERERVAVDRFEFLVREARAAAKRENPRLATKVLAHELAHWVDNLPDNYISQRGNILGRFATVVRHLKAELAMEPGGPDGLTKVDRNKLRSDARKRVREQGMSPKDAGFNQAVNEMYHKLRDRRRAEAGLVTKEQIQEELAGVIAWWRGTAVMEQYFEAPAEMYAESLSAYMLNPAEFARRAPKAFRLLENYIERKPSVKKIWDKLQDDIVSGQVQRDRVENLRTAFREGDAAELRQRTVLGRTRADWVDAIERAVDRKYGPVYRRARGADNELDLVEAIAKFRYKATTHELWMTDINRMVMAGLVDKNLTWTDLDEYLFHYRVMNERAELANPLGWNPAASAERLQAWETELGSERFGALEAARQAFRKIYEEQVLEPFVNSGMVDAELREYLMSNEGYAAFVVHHGVQDPVEAMLTARYGGAVSAGIYKQAGTFQKIRGPATATVEKGIRMVDAAFRNVAKRETIQMMLAAHPDEIHPAEMKWDGRRMSPVMVDNARVKTLVYLEDGQVRAYHLPKALAEAFESDSSTEMLLMAGLNAVLSRPLKTMYTGVNYGLWPVLWIRDYFDFMRRMMWFRGDKFKRPPQYWRFFPEAVQAARSMGRGEPNETARRAMDRGLVISQGNPYGIYNDEEAITRLLKAYRQQVRSGEESPALRDKIANVWSNYLGIGQILERSSKIAGMLYLDEQFGQMPEAWRNQQVRAFSGSQDFLDTPTMLPAIDILAMFYNPWKQAWRSEFKSAQQHGRAIYAYNQMKYSVMPTILKWMMYAAGGSMLAGILGERRAKDLSEQMQAIPDYDLSTSHVIPLGWDDYETRKVRYIRLPQSENQRIISALVWRMLPTNADVSAGEAAQQALSYGADQLPSGNPLVNVGTAFWQFYMHGQNPVDGRNGYEIIPRTMFDAKAPEAHGHLLKHAANEMGAGLIHRFELHEDLQEPTALQEFLKLPIVSNTLGRFVRVSNRGIWDQVRPINDQVRQQRAGERHEVQQALRRDEIPEIRSEYQGQTLERELEARARSRTATLREQLLDRASSAEARDRMAEKLFEILGE